MSSRPRGRRILFKRAKIEIEKRSHALNRQANIAIWNERIMEYHSISVRIGIAATKEDLPAEV